MKIVVSGGTGFLGRALVGRLAVEGHRVVVLTRRSSIAELFPQQQSIHAEQWDAKTLGSWASSVDGANAVVNLAGELIGGKRWTLREKERIMSSRVNATCAIVEAIGRATSKPAVLVSASAVGYYGGIEQGDVTESHPKGTGFLSEVTDRWEREAWNAERVGVRVVVPRFGVVLEKDGGVLQKFMLPFKLFVGGPLGSGKQWFPWIHREDVIDIVRFAINEESLTGVVNATAPEPVTMNEFCAALGRAMHRPCWLRVPAPGLRLLFGEMAETVLTGQRVLPQKLLEAGYMFRYSTLDHAFRAIFQR